jgi:DNA-binding Lrp family transcriptional regulator
LNNVRLKDAELKLISELMKNSHRSDRELAKAMGISQPTVTRIRRKLEKEGYIKEYTIIPDFNKLGYEILAFTFIKLGQGFSEDDIRKAQRIAQERLKEARFGIIMIDRGVSKDAEGIIVSFHKDLESYINLRNQLREFDFLGISHVDSFLISTRSNQHYGSLTFSSLANHLLTLGKPAK